MVKFLYMLANAFMTAASIISLSRRAGFFYRSYKKNNYHQYTGRRYRK